MSAENLETLLAAAGLGILDSRGGVDYVGFVDWLMVTSRAATKEQVGSRAATKEEIFTAQRVLPQLQGIADRLADISQCQWMKSADRQLCAELAKHAVSLRQICRQNFHGDEVQAIEEEFVFEERCTHPDDAAFTIQMRRDTEDSSIKISGELRAQAAQVVEATGACGDFIDDLQEVSIADVHDKMAIAYWRFCKGLRVFRSELVTKALRLICSAPVPGLGGPSYLEVFNGLTQNLDWENHIYLFGGLVRDILRRTVGNDIDIGFSAPACELESICQRHGYTCHVDGDYIIIGDENGEEYLEGMVIAYNGIQSPEHADFAMNTLFYDFKNDIIIDKTGIAIPALIANQVTLPCPRERWKSWLDINGVRVCFRFYKFILRGFQYETAEMTFVVQMLLKSWTEDAEHTVETGRIALGNLVSCSDVGKIERLRQIVFTSFELVDAEAPQTRITFDTDTNFARCISEPDMPTPSPSPKASRQLQLSFPQSSDLFLSASTWWQKGWLPLLKLHS
eukprot:TRINITY_DN29298_c0_g1_i1.p1 TRINITY_DN29298_c0_g1~~TRINITY_DN29298_c0_g1_i1.p1  ORF type:complete len:568 (-),score=103.69 TRINITY_DN29298_c0_g1_i1:19-1545(-)